MGEKIKMVLTATAYRIRKYYRDKKSPTGVLGVVYHPIPSADCIAIFVKEFLSTSVEGDEIWLRRIIALGMVLMGVDGGLVQNSFIPLPAARLRDY
ncbi:hypothetical protein ACNKHQ_03845 [Shigella flexneri]